MENPQELDPEDEILGRLSASLNEHPDLFPPEITVELIQALRHSGNPDPASILSILGRVRNREAS